MIRKTGKGKWTVYGEKKTKKGKKRKFGTYSSLKAAKNRLRQIEWFKHRKG